MLSLLYLDLWGSIEIENEKYYLSNPTTPSASPASKSVLATDEDQGSSFNSPIKIYIPFKTGNGDFEEAQSRLRAEGSTNYLPTDTSGQLSFNFKPTSYSDGKIYLYIGLYYSSINQYRVIALGETANNIASDYLEFTSSSDYRKIFVDIPTICEDVNTGCVMSTHSTDEAIAEVATLYVFAQSSNSDLIGSTIDPTDTNYAGGKYIQLKFSNYLPQRPPRLVEVSRGDGQATIVYDANISVLKQFAPNLPFKIVTMTYTTSGAQGENKLSTAANINQLNKTFNDKTEYYGHVVLTPLANNTEHHVAVAIENIYQFVSVFSATQSVIPRDMETFLEEQQCYLLSAGFQKDHYVLEYFREFRDNILLNSKIGTAFVDFYYDFAPSLTPFIIEHIWAQNIVQSLGFILYILMNFGFRLVIFSFIIYLFWRIYKTQRKSET